MRNFRVTVDGNVYDVQVEEVSSAMPKMQPIAMPAQETAAILTPAPAVNPAPVAMPANSAPKAKATGGTEINAPMPGMVTNYKVTEGATVKKGDVVLVLEAMKMENDISSPADGVVSFVAAKGSTVATGEVLAIIS